MSDKALITREVLELTQKIQREFPPGVDTAIIGELNGYPREEFQKRLLTCLLNRLRPQVISTNGVIAPKGGIVLPFTMLVDESRAWNEAIKAAGPNTAGDSGVWKVGEKFPSLAGATEQLQQVWLVNFGKGSVTPSQAALVWGKKQNLVSASPRACFAIAEHYPKFNTYLGMDPIVVVSLLECSFGGESHLCGVWFGGLGREASLDWFGSGWRDNVWFAFVRELTL